MVMNHGEKFAIQRLKELRRALQQFSLRQTVTPIPFLKTDEEGFPKCISFVKPDRNDAYHVRYSLSFFRIVEEFRCKPELDPSTITDMSACLNERKQDIISFIHKSSILGCLPELDEGYLVLSNKAGPNGPATINAMKDLSALQAEPDLWKDIQELMKYSTPDIFSDKCTPHQGEFLHSKLVLLSDKACKTRVIAIADWWTNTALTSLHKAFMKGLQKLPSDVTYRQSSIPKLIQGLGRSLFSSDMTAFTDRFPIDLGEEVIKAAYGSHISGLWKRITTHRAFTHKGVKYHYRCGSPMGLLSTWAVSTFTHHVIKHYCAYKLGVQGYKYLILGDDTLDTNETVYNYYTQVIKDLGVSISLAKCTQSSQGYTEFAKRLFAPQGELTGLPVSLLMELKTKPEQFIELVRLCRERGYEDKYLEPVISSLLSHHKKGALIADMLSLPVRLSGMPPLLKVKPETAAANLCAASEEVQDILLQDARNYVFWNTANKLELRPVAKSKVCQITVEPSHPLIYGLSAQIDGVLYDEALFGLTTEGDYSIYNQWMKGEYQHLLNLPSVNTYRFYNKGHKVTKCKFEVFKALCAIAQGDTKIRLTSLNKLSNQDIMGLALRDLY